MQQASLSFKHFDSHKVTPEFRVDVDLKLFQTSLNFII